MSWRGASSNEQDPCLTQNHGYFVDHAELAAHLEVHKGQPQEVSKAYSPFIPVDCACHSMKQPNSIGDLQLGEKYVIIIF